MNPIELPPILSGSTQQQLAQLRDYLLRTVRRQNAEAAAPAAPGAPAARAAVQSAEEARTQAASLRALIVKTADAADSGAQEALSRAEVAQHSVGELQRHLESDYIARSDFGAYAQQVTADIEATARAITESYRYAELVSAAAAAGVSDALTQYMTLIDGQLRRGYLTDPDTGETVFGIAMSQKLRFTGSTQTVDGETCYELDGAQTFGLYTATGWQFWVGGRKIGWFDSADGMLHVTRLAAEQELRLGADWLVTAEGGFGVRYIGG